MSIFSRALHLIDFDTRNASTSPTEPSPSVVRSIPPRPEPSIDPLTMNAVFRGVQILQTAVSSLKVNQYRHDRKLPAHQIASIVSKPNIFQTRANFISDTVASLALNGNAFWLKQYDVDGNVINLVQLEPHLVFITNATPNALNPDLRFHYGSCEWTSDDIIHLKFMSVPGRLRGLGPLSAAREEVFNTSQRKTRKEWYADAQIPNGILSGPKDLSSTQTMAAKNALIGAVENGEPLVIAGEWEYTYPSLAPQDAQALAERKYDTTAIARLLGIPSSLMLASQEGTSLTYSNIEQEWVQFADFTLAAYTDDIADALSDLVPHGNSVRFEYDSLRRSDTKTRMQTYEIALKNGIMSIDEVREKLDLEPLTPPIHDEVH